MASEPKRVKLYGERNSGTNWLSHLVARIEALLAPGTRRAGPFRNLSVSTKRDGKSYETYRQHHLGNGWREGWSPDDAAHVARQLDADLVRQLGYEPL